MRDHLHFAPAAVRARVRELGGDRLLAALSSLVYEEEESAACWFDAKSDDEQADQVEDWSVVDVAAFGDTVAYVEVGIQLTVWPWPDPGDQSSMSVVVIPAFARVLLGATPEADRFRLDCDDLRSYVAAEVERGPAFDDAGATNAQVAAYLASSRTRARAQDRGPRPRVYVMVDSDNLIISGTPVPAHEEADDASPPGSGSVGDDCGLSPGRESPARDCSVQARQPRLGARRSYRGLVAGPRWTDDELRPLREAFPMLDSIPDHDLPRLWAAIMLKMSTRGLIRAQRSIPGEVAEALVAAYLGGRLAQSASQKDVDVEAGDELIQVKALRYTDPGRNSVGQFRLGPKGFTRLIVVCFDYDMTPLEAWSVTSAELDDLLTKGSSPAHGRLTLGPSVKSRMRRIPAEELLEPRAGLKRISGEDAGLLQHKDRDRD